jgi:hypothetical protein
MRFATCHPDRRKGTSNMQPGIVTKEPRPVREDLEALPSATLWDVARNPDAVHRKLAALILIERCSPYIRRVEIADEVEKILATTVGPE